MAPARQFSETLAAHRPRPSNLGQARHPLGATLPKAAARLGLSRSVEIYAIAAPARVPVREILARTSGVLGAPAPQILKCAPRLSDRLLEAAMVLPQISGFASLIKISVPSAIPSPAYALGSTLAVIYAARTSTEFSLAVFYVASAIPLFSAQAVRSFARIALVASPRKDAVGG